MSDLSYNSYCFKRYTKLNNAIHAASLNNATKPRDWRLTLKEDSTSNIVITYPKKYAGFRK